MDRALSVRYKFLIAEESRPVPYLEFEAQRRALGPGVLTIGSGTEAAWRIHGHDLLPLHALVTLERSGAAMVARGSSSATLLINGVEQPEGKGTLRYGDTLRLGSAEFRYSQTAHRAGEARQGYLRDMRRGRVYRLAQHAELGRDPRCAINIQEPEVSRVHAEIVVDQGRFLARSIGAAYTLLNEKRLTEPVELREGDELTIGRTVLRFSSEAPMAHVTPEDRRAVERPHLGSRSSKMQTVYMGAVEAREKVDRGHRRRIGLAIAAVVMVMAVLYILVR
jgi:predicted component of type VI protein secretion system